MAKDPQTVAALYRQGVAGAGAKYQAGVQAAASDWEQQAKSNAAEEAYAQGVQRAASQKTRQKALQNVSGSQWAQSAAEVGAPNYTAAASRAAQKFEQVVGDVIAAGEAGRSAARNIQGATMESRLQRSVESAKAVHRYWANKKGVTPEV